MESPRFCIVVPAYEAESTLADTLDAILAQTFSAWECIVVDDGSTDGTGTIALDYSRRDPRFKTIAQANQGTAGAYNTGARQGSAPLLVLCSADDLLLPDHLRVMDELISSNPACGIFSSNGDYLLETGSRARVYSGDEWEHETSLSFEDVLTVCFFSVGATFRRSVFERVGGYRVGVYGEDYDFWLRAMAAGVRHRYTPQVLSLHRISAVQKSASILRVYDSNIEVYKYLVSGGWVRTEQVPLVEAAIVARRKLRKRVKRQLWLQEDAEAAHVWLSRVVGRRAADATMQAMRAAYARLQHAEGPVMDSEPSLAPEPAPGRLDAPRPSLALVVAAYNAEQTLADAIDSVLRQPYDNWQVLVVNDGSTDRTLEIAQAYAANDKRIRVFSQENAGAGAARNAAIPLVDAEYTGYLDADDMLADDHMETMLGLMADFPGRDIYSSDGRFVFEDGSTELVFGYKRTTVVSLDDLLAECRILGGGALVRTEVLRALGGFREHMYGEDYDLWLRAIGAGYSHVASPRPLYIYHRCVKGQKSEDPEAGCNSAVIALTDLIDTGALTKDQQKRAKAAIANYLVGPRLEQQAQRFRSGVESVVGIRLAGPVMRAVHAVSWTVRPLRRKLAGKRRA